MLGLGAATRIYVATGATDMRLGYDGLYGLVRERLACDPLSGHLYLGYGNDSVQTGHLASTA